MPSRQAIVQSLLGFTRSEWLRNRYWDLRFSDLDAAYGTATEDYPLIEQMIAASDARSVFDFGCGSGRYFPLYSRLRIEEAVGEDVSESAISACRQRFPDPRFSFLCAPVERLDYSPGHFDLGISNRSLSAVPPHRIDAAIEALSRICRYIYLNELTERDYVGPSTYWFKHGDLPARFEAAGMTLIDHNLYGSGEWVLMGPASAKRSEEK